MKMEHSHPSRESERLSLLPPDLLLAWRARFVNRSHPYALQQGDGSYRWVYEELTDDVLAAHLRGELTLAPSSTDARAWCRWACLDVDVPGALPELLAVRDALAEIGFPGLVVGSRRGGHLWLCFDELLPATAVRYAVSDGLAEVAAADLEVPAHELYPDTGVAGVLGHAVRLPLGLHRKTGQRYPPYDDEGLPCLFSSVARAVSFVLEATTPLPASRVQERWAAFLAEEKTRRRTKKGAANSARDLQQGLGDDASAPSAVLRNRVRTRSAVIRWVDAHVSPLDLLDELVPEVELQSVGQGYLGWCPFHDDR